MPPGNRVISVTGCNFTQIVCAAGPILFYLEIKDGKIVQNGDTTLEHEVACIDITPLNETDNKSEIVGVGLWTDITVRLLKLPSLEEITKESLGGDIIPRSILMAQVWSYLTNIGGLRYFWKGIWSSKAQKPVTLSCEGLISSANYLRISLLW